MTRPGMGEVTVPTSAAAAPERAHTRGTGLRNSCTSPPTHISSTWRTRTRACLVLGPRDLSVLPLILAMLSTFRR